MRKLLILAAALVACSRAETPAADTTAAPPMAAPAPAKLTVADVQGTWKGETKADPGDTVVNRWTAAAVTDSTGTVTIEGTKDPIPFKRVLDADSMIATSVAFPNPADAKGPKVMFRSIGRLKDGKLVGTSATLLASKPDSVLSRGKWEASRAP